MKTEKEPLAQASLSADEQQVVEYLRHHPAFFDTHRELLAELEMSHDSGIAVSLIERQVQILRQQRQELTQRLEQLMDTARENEAISEDMHQFMLVLMDADNLADVFGIVDDYLRTEFDADAIAIRLVSGTFAMEYPEVGQLDERALTGFENMLMAGSPSCDHLNQEQRYYLFGAEGADIVSNVVIPLQDDNLSYGILAIGSTDPERYHPEMGTIFLRRFGEFLTHILKRFVGRGV